jgi:ribosome-associated heat shock protein Hsp15
MPTEKTPPDRMRLDKWLWTARFFKTRSLATQAVDQGRVKLNGERIKPAPVAQRLYEEDPASHARRLLQMSERKLDVRPAAVVKGRPTKRDRRQIHRFTGE